MGYNEEGTVEEPILKELQKLDWKYISPEQMRKMRNEDFEEVLLIKNVKESITRINKELELTDTDLDFCIRQLKTIAPTIDGIKKFLDIFRNGMLIPIQKDNKEKIVRVVDLEEKENKKNNNNEFIVTNQFRVEGPLGNIRADVVLLVNGIPIVLIEAKSPTSESADWLQAYTDIKIYEEKTPDLFKFVQISIATDGEKSYYFPNGFNEEGKDFLYQWKDTYPHDPQKVGSDKLKVMVYGLLSRYNLLDIIENFTFIREENSGTTKITARYVQFRAASKIFNRVIDRLTKKDDKNFGLIWHWQGSGKTYAMAFSSWKLLNSPDAKKPSIFVLVDRKDLEEQVERDFGFIKVPIERIGTIKKLIEVLTWGGEGKRGIFLVTIEKFSPKEFIQLEKEGKKLEIARENVIVFADEVHRTQYGKLATLMRSVFKNASIFGFTGTPLSKSERNTFGKFSPPKELYLDRYSMLDALNDGVTVQISYKPKLPEYHLNEKELKALAKFEEIEIEDLTKEEKKELRKRIKPTKAFLMKDKRIEEITHNIANHFSEAVEPSEMKAMIVTDDRGACVKYKKFLDKFLPSIYSEIVMSFSSKEKDKDIRDFVTSQQKKYGSTSQRDIHNKIVYDFKTKDEPKILIVTDMLITGFDSPNLWVMYMDKSLKEHRILQAIARTNRPFLNKKFGLIIDYIGVLKELESAFKQFEAKDEKDLRAVVRNFEKDEEEFKAQITYALKFFEGVSRENSRESLNDALDKLIDSDVAKQYENIMTELTKSYEMLKGEAVLKDYLHDYTWLTKTYVAYYKRFKKKNVDEMKILKLSKKTMDLIQKTIDIDEIEEAYPTMKIDEKFIDALKTTGTTDIGSAIDILTSIHKEAEKHPTSPFFQGISKQIERAFLELRKRKQKVENVMQQVTGISEKIVERKKNEEKIGKNVYSIYEIIEDVIPDMPKEKIISISNSILKHLREKELLFKEWQEQKDVRRKIKTEIRFKLLTEFKGYSTEKIDNLMDGIFTVLESIREI